MRIYISADMEGTAGVVSWAQVDPSNAHEYPVYRRYMTREVAAAIEGARVSGGREFLVNDSHWDMRNLLWDELPEDVRMISGARKPLSMAQGAEQRFDAAFFTGYHAKIGEANAVLSHTYSDATLYDVRVNGTPCTEALLNAALLGLYGTPVVLVTGDRTTIESIAKHAAVDRRRRRQRCHRLLQCEHAHPGDGMCRDSRGRARSAGHALARQALHLRCADRADHRDRKNRAGRLHGTLAPGRAHRRTRDSLSPQ